MRIWDISPKKLCNKHLFGEHRELHAIFSILTNNKKGYSKHPETRRWAGKEMALYLRHEKLREEIIKRNYRHNSPLNENKVSGKERQDEFINTKSEQKIILARKNCDCFLRDKSVRI